MPEAKPIESSEPSGFKLAMTLAIAGLVSGLALVGTYEATLPTITANKAAALKKAAFDAVPASHDAGGASLQKLVLEDGALAVAAEGEGWAAIRPPARRPALARAATPKILAHAIV